MHTFTRGVFRGVLRVLEHPLQLEYRLHELRYLLAQRSAQRQNTRSQRMRPKGYDIAAVPRVSHFRHDNVYFEVLPTLTDFETAHDCDDVKKWVWHYNVACL